MTVYIASWSRTFKPPAASGSLVQDVQAALERQQVTELEALAEASHQHTSSLDLQVVVDMADQRIAAETVAARIQAALLAAGITADQARVEADEVVVVEA